MKQYKSDESSESWGFWVWGWQEIVYRKSVAYMSCEWNEWCLHLMIFQWSLIKQ